MPRGDDAEIRRLPMLTKGAVLHEVGAPWQVEEI